MSDVIDEEWMLLDELHWKMCGFPRRIVSQCYQVWRRMRMQGISSPGMHSREGQEMAERPAPIGFTGDFMRHGQ